MCNPRRPENHLNNFHLTRTQYRILIKIFAFIPFTDSNPFIINPHKDQAGKANVVFGRIYIWATPKNRPESLFGPKVKFGPKFAFASTVWSLGEFDMNRVESVTGIKAKSLIKILFCVLVRWKLFDWHSGRLSGRRGLHMCVTVHNYDRFHVNK